MSDKYTQTPWIDRNVVDPNNATITKSGGGAISSGDTVAIVANPTSVINAGTTPSQANMNNMEDGITRANNSININDNLLPDAVALCEDVSLFTNATSTDEDNTENRKYGKSCAKLILSSTSGYLQYDALSLVDITKYYLISCWLKNGDTTLGLRLRVDCQGDAGDTLTDYVTSTTYTRVGLLIKPSDFDTATNLYIRLQGNGASSEFGYFDGLMLREITAKEYALGVTTLLTKYPFSSSEGIESRDEIISLGTIYEGMLDAFLKGRSVVNLLEDDDAGLEATTGWTDSSGTSSNDSTDNLEGTNCRKFVLSASSGFTYKDFLSKLDISKYYLVSMYVKNEDVTNCYLSVNCVDDAGLFSHAGHTGTYYARQGIALQPSDFDGASAVRVQFICIGSSSEFAFADALMINEITKTEYESLSDPEDASSLLSSYPYHRGMGHVEPCRLKSVNKNLVQNGSAEDGIELWKVNSSGTVTTENDTFVFVPTLANRTCTNTKYIKTDTNKTYTASGQLKSNGSASAQLYAIYYNINQQFISEEIVGTVTASSLTTVNKTLTIPTGCVYTRLYVYNSGSVFTIEFRAIQLELGSSATDYVPHKNSQGYCPVTLRCVPSASDSFRFKDGMYVNRVELDEDISDTDYDTYETGGTNTDYVNTTVFSLKVTGTTGIDGQLIYIDKDGKRLTEVASADIDSLSSIGKFSSGSGGRINIILAKGAYANIAAARIGLGTTKALYERATPNDQIYYPSAALQCWEDGTLFSEKAVEEILVYDSLNNGLTISNTDLLINSLDYIYKIDDNNDTETPIDISTAAIASTKLTSTLSGASDGDRYRFARNYFGAGTRPTLYYNYSMSSKGGQDGHGEQILELDKKIDRIANRATKGRWELISFVGLSADATQVDIAAPTDLKEILLVGYELRASAGTIRNLQIRFNDDSGANYNWNAGSGVNQITLTNILPVSTADNHGYFEFRITNNSADTYKMAFSQYASSADSAQEGGAWANTSELIDEINITANADDINEGAVFILYGRRA